MSLPDGPLTRLHLHAIYPNEKERGKSGKSPQVKITFYDADIQDPMNRPNLLGHITLTRAMMTKFTRVLNFGCRVVSVNLSVSGDYFVTARESANYLR